MRNGRPDFTLATPGRVSLATGQADPQAGVADDGTFSCVASIFEQRIPRMFYDMILRPNCFDRSLTERGLPSLVWSHDWQVPAIGTVQRCEEAGLNLEADATLFPAETDLLRVLRMAMTERNGDGRPPIREFSIGFDVIDAQWDIIDEEEVLAVTNGELYEFGPCLVGAVTGTGFLSAPDPEELLSRFPRPEKDPAEEDRATVARLERAYGRALRA